MPPNFTHGKDFRKTREPPDRHLCAQGKARRDRRHDRRIATPDRPAPGRPDAYTLHAAPHRPVFSVIETRAKRARFSTWLFRERGTVAPHLCLLAPKQDEYG